MTMMRATARPVDRARAARLLLAWIESDEVALRAVLDEASADEPTGVNALLFVTVESAAQLALAISPDNCVDQLRRSVLAAVVADEPDA